MDIRFQEFATDEQSLAKIIYGNEPHLTTNQGVVLSSKVREELCAFLDGYNQWVNIAEQPYYRIDAYFDHGAMSILEINAWFVDGWGTALNLARASGISIDAEKLIFPNRFALEATEYLPELQLFLYELGATGKWGNRILDDIDKELKTYVYGRIGTGNPMAIPHDGQRIDNKLNLAEYCQIWDGELVRLPKHYTSMNATWDDIPTNAVLKFCDKSSEQCKQARRSVLIGKPSGKAPFLRKCFEEGQLIAQDFVQPMVHESTNCQLVILAIGNSPITGYVQYSPSAIINDNSVHGPLMIK
ncbi:MAG TPA: hypothetical protein VG965_01725 [Patescibacteria group bacterium]|nr:hypothetical protein [Patescibacteria group bacterium]